MGLDSRGRKWCFGRVTFPGELSNTTSNRDNAEVRSLKGKVVDVKVELKSTKKELKNTQQECSDLKSTTNALQYSLKATMDELAMMGRYFRLFLLDGVRKFLTLDPDLTKFPLCVDIENVAPNIDNLMCLGNELAGFDNITYLHIMTHDSSNGCLDTFSNPIFPSIEEMGFAIGEYMKYPNQITNEIECDIIFRPSIEGVKYSRMHSLYRGTIGQNYVNIGQSARSSTRLLTRGIEAHLQKKKRMNRMSEKKELAKLLHKRRKGD
ncbi:Uncharacterized protein Fot_12081 [Forsythia ovata]|uniref:Uncharacterized protein n=1 Tax=Forsythia ovata TaxID=205694 RepID=A0ABD1WLV6_9LAMI